MPDQPSAVQLLGGLLPGVALVAPLWWANRSLRWQHATAIVLVTFLAGAYRLTLPRWAITRPVSAFAALSTFIAPPAATSAQGYLGLPLAQPFLAGCLVGLILQRATRSMRWQHTLLIASAWTFSEIVFDAAIRMSYQHWFAGGPLPLSVHYRRWSLVRSLANSALLYAIFRFAARRGRKPDPARPSVVALVKDLSRPNVMTHQLAGGRFGTRLYAMGGSLVVGMGLARLLLGGRPSTALVLPAFALTLLPAILVSAITAAGTVEQARDTHWDLLRLTNLTRQEIMAACFQAGLVRAFVPLVMLILSLAVLSVGVMRVYTGLFLSLTPLTLPNPFKWQMSLLSFPFFITGVTLLGGALGVRFGLRLRSWQAVVLAPLTMLTVMLAAIMLAQNYWQSTLSIVSEAMLFAALPWLVTLEVMDAAGTDNRE